MSAVVKLTESINSGTLPSDKLAIIGKIYLDPADTTQLLIGDLGSTVLTTNTDFTLATYTGTWDNDTCAGVPDNSTLTVGVNQFRINYDNGAVTLTTPVAVPEPRSLGLIGLGAVSLLRRRRRIL